MDVLIIVVVFAAIAALLSVPFLILQAIAQARRLRAIETAVRKLQRQASGAAAASGPVPAAPKPAQPKPESSKPQTAEPVAPERPPALVVVPRPERAAPVQARSIELLIGTRFLAWIGAVVLVIGVSLFVKYTIDHSMIGPVGRVISGGILGAAMVVGSQWPRLRKLEGFAQVLAGAGHAIWYVCIWYAFEKDAIISQSLAFAAASVTTVSGILIAARNDWISTCALALLGGYASPILLSTGVSRPHVLFPYLAILAMLAMGCATLRGWRGVNVLAFAGTVALATAWFAGDYSVEQRWIAAGYFALLYVVFCTLPLAHGLVHRKRGTLESAALLAANAAAGFAGFHAVLWSDQRIAFSWITLGMAAFALALLQAFRLRPAEDAKTKTALLAQGLVLLLVAAPIRFELDTVPIAWALEGLLLGVIARVWGSRACVGFSVAALVLAAGTLLANLPLHEGGFRPVLNRPFGSWLLVAAVAAACARWWRLATLDLSWLGWLAAVALACTVGHVEIVEYWQALAGQSPAARQAGATESLLVLWAIYPAAVTAVAALAKDRPRVFAGLGLALLAFAAAVFLLSLSVHRDVPQPLALNPTFAARSLLVAGVLACVLLWRRVPDWKATISRLGAAAVCTFAVLTLHFEIWWFYDVRTTTWPGAPVARATALVALWAIACIGFGLGAARRSASAPRVLIVPVLAGATVFAWSFAHYPDGAEPLFVHSAFGARLLFVLATGACAWLARRAPPIDLGPPNGIPVRPFLELVANACLAAVVAVEVVRWSASTDVVLPLFGKLQTAFGQGCISALWSAQALALIVAGLVQRLRYRRILGLCLFAVAVTKVSLIDTRNLAQVFRILSFGATGLLLLIGSGVYYTQAKKLLGSEGSAPAG